MNTKHTPGPWSVGRKSGYKTVLLNARGESIASGGNNRAVQGAELEASLVLAAAAPELLAYARLEQARSISEDLAETALVLAGWDRTPGTAQAFADTMRNAAIAKATGGAA